MFSSEYLLNNYIHVIHNKPDICELKAGLVLYWNLEVNLKDRLPL